MNNLNKLIASRFRELADDFDSGNSNVTEGQAMDILTIVGHQRMSREQAANYLNMPINTFNMYVSLGKIPKPRKEVGFKEGTWYRDELDKVIYKNKKSLTH